MKLESIFREILQSVANPAGYFKNIADQNTISSSILKIVVYALVSGLFLTIIAAIATDMSDGFGFLAPIFAFALTIPLGVGGIALLFVGALIVMILSTVSGGDADYKKSVYVAAAVEVIFIPMVVIALKSHFDETLAYFINVFCYWGGIMMLYNALIYTLNGKRLPAVIIAVLLIALSLLPVKNHPQLF